MVTCVRLDDFGSPRSIYSCGGTSSWRPSLRFSTHVSRYDRAFGIPRTNLWLRIGPVLVIFTCFESPAHSLNQANSLAVLYRHSFPFLPPTATQFSDALSLGSIHALLVERHPRETICVRGSQARLRARSHIRCQSHRVANADLVFAPQTRDCQSTGFGGQARPPSRDGRPPDAQRAQQERSCFSSTLRLGC